MCRMVREIMGREGAMDMTANGKTTCYRNPKVIRRATESRVPHQESSVNALSRQGTVVDAENKNVRSAGA